MGAVVVVAEVVVEGVHQLPTDPTLLPVALSMATMQVVTAEEVHDQ